MALKEKITQEDLHLYEIFRNPVLFAEFVNNVDKVSYEEPFELTEYQKDIMCDFNNHVELCCARAVGKTVSLSWLITWALVFNIFPNDYIIYTVPNKVHLQPVFTSLIRLFRSNSVLKQFIAKNRGINSADFTIELLNDAKLMCRIAGQSGRGENVIGLHTPMVILDEAGYYPWGTWMELQPTINTWTPGYKVFASGVPTGLREENVLYHVDQENTSYTKHRVTAYDNPRFSKEEELRAEEQYGGKESDDFLHFVLGLHGHPIFALFDRGNFEIEPYGVTHLKLNGLDLKDNIGEYITRLGVIPNVKDKHYMTIFGIDLGYTEPTAIIILVIDQDNRMKFHARIRLDKVSYPIQEKIIDLLDSRFSPQFIGIDQGGVGRAVVQSLQDDPAYSDKEYRKRIVGVDFSSSIILGTDSAEEEIKSKTKPLATSVLQDYSNQHKIIYSSTDPDMITELERMTYSKTPTGEIVYKTLTPGGGQKGEDHFTSALLCASLAYYLNNDFSFKKSNRKAKLLSFGWLGV